jgi:hypothetical protein
MAALNHRNLNEGRALGRQADDTRRGVAAIASAMDGNGHDRLLRRQGNAT